MDKKAGADWAKGIAERLLKDKDFRGAQYSALRAQALFPELEGLSKFLEVVNIYIAYEHKIYTEADHYGVMGLDPLADEDTIKKTYRRMALSLHPDKNRIDGAAGAFSILNNAYEVLSNKEKRSKYDTRLYELRAQNRATNFFDFMGTSQPEDMAYGTFFPYDHRAPPAETAGSSQQAGPFFPMPGRTPYAGNQESSAFASSSAPFHFAGNQGSSAPFASSSAPSSFAGNEESSGPSPPPPIPEQRRTQEKAPAAESVPAKKPSSRGRFRKQSRASTLESFWTGCDSCRIKYEFEKKFVGQTLRCPRCQQPFLAVEMPAPPSKRKQEDPVVAESDGPTNMPPENVGKAAAKSAPCGGLDREKPRKRRRKETGQQTISEHQSRVIVMGWAKRNTLNQLNKWKKVG